MAKLIIQEGERRRIYEICETELHIGSSAENEIRLRDPAASSVHCRIRRTPAGYQLVDLESRAGTRVNGRFVNQHLLQHGDVIQIGRVKLAFRADSPAERAALSAPARGRPFHAARRKKGLPPGVLAGLALLAVGLLVFAVWKALGKTQYEGQRVLEEARAELKKTVWKAAADETELQRVLARNRQHLEKARRLLASYPKLPAGERTRYTDQIYRDRLKELERQTAILKDMVHRFRARKDYFRLSNEAVRLARDGHYAEAIKLCQSYLDKYPDSTYRRNMELKIKRWLKAMKGEGANVADVLKVIEDHIANERFKEAKALIESLRWRRAENVAKLNALYKKLGDAEATAWQRRHREAQEYAEVGNFRVAAEIYREILKTFGSERFRKQAQEELAKLKLRR